MKACSILNVFWLALIGLFLGLSSPAQAEGDPLLNKARDLLHKAWNPDGDAPNDADRTAMLKSALTLLKKAPPGAYHGHKLKAIEFINSALFELQKGDPDHKVTDYIRNALDQVRDIT